MCVCIVAISKTHHLNQTKPNQPKMKGVKETRQFLWFFKRDRFILHSNAMGEINCRTMNVSMCECAIFWIVTRWSKQCHEFNTTAFARWLQWKWKKIFRDWNLRLCSFMFEYNFFPCVLTKIGVVPHLLGLNVGTKATCTCGWFEVILTYFLFVVATPNI